MNILTQEARKKQEIVKQAIKNGKSYTSRKYGVSLSTLKRWCKKYDGKFKWTYDEKKKLFGTVCVVKIREVKKNRPALPLLLPKDHPEVKRMEEVMGMKGKTE